MMAKTAGQLETMKNSIQDMGTLQSFQNEMNSLEKMMKDFLKSQQGTLNKFHEVSSKFCEKQSRRMLQSPTDNKCKC